MKVQHQLEGIFYRTQLSGTNFNPVSLVDLVREVQATGSDNHKRSPELLRQSLGLNFLPKPLLINLLKQAQGVITESDLYQLPALKLLHFTSYSTSQVANTYHYQFTSQEAAFNLTPDDPQIPSWIGNNLQQPGTYTITLIQPVYPGLPDDFVNNIWQTAINQWQDLPDIDKIHVALQSLNHTNFRYHQLWIYSEDLSLDLRAVITFLRFGGGDISLLSTAAQLLTQQYQATYNIPIKKIPSELNLDSSSRPAQKFIINRENNRFYLKNIISDARQFLLISSYIIEDESITELICRKSQELSQGVWILTDLRDEVIDSLDMQVSNSERQEFQRSDERKKACLKQLLDANIPIYSGAFHLKAYISEQYAYLGSCNLTGGSLDFNLEAGIIFRNNLIHTQLVNIFRQWQQRSRDEVIPINNRDGFRLRSISHFYRGTHERHPFLLTPSQYQRDLIEQLSNFNGQVQIYSRSFHPSPEIEHYLNLLDTRIFVDSQLRHNYSSPRFQIQRVDKLHAKITFLGGQVAYIGGINFNFNSKALPLNDLMYKTTNPQEISQIRELVQNYV